MDVIYQQFLSCARDGFSVLKFLLLLYLCLVISDSIHIVGSVLSKLLLMLDLPNAFEYCFLSYFVQNAELVWSNVQGFVGLHISTRIYYEIYLVIKRDTQLM
jgi:hypothetical protein